MSRIDWSKLLTAGILIERTHCILRQLSPHYASCIDSVIESTKRSLRLKRTLADEMCRFIGTDNPVWIWRPLRHHLQLDCFAKIVEKDLSIEKKVNMGPKLTEDLDIHDFEGFSENLDCIAEGDVEWEYNLPREEVLPLIYVPEELRDKREDSVLDLYYGLFFAYYNDIPLLFFVRPMLEYDQICVVLGDTDFDKISGWLTSAVDKANKFNPYFRCVISISAGETDGDLKFLPMDKLSIDLRYRKPFIDRNLFSEDVYKTVFVDIPEFIKKQQDLCLKGFDGRRAYLLVGPPGSGKSYILRNIVEQLPDNYTVVLVTSKSIDLMSRIDNYEFLYPVLFLIEDIDLMIGSGRDRQNLQNFLDGITSPAKMVTIMTSNSPELLDDALVKRPGRIDRISYVLPGNLQQRTSQIKILTNDINVSMTAEEMSLHTEGMTFAQHREIIRRALIYSKSVDTIDDAAFDDASAECKKQFSDDLKNWKQYMAKQLEKCTR